MLDRLCAEYWEGNLEASPVTATILGDRRYDDRLPDLSPAATARDQKRLESVLSRVQALDAKALSPADRLTRSALMLEVQKQLDQISCRFEEWNVDPLNGPEVWLMNLADVTVIRNAKDASNYLTRCRAIAGLVDQHVANLTRGLADGRVATRIQVDKGLANLDALLGQAPAEWPIARIEAGAKEGFGSADRDRLRADVASVVEKSARPAFQRYREFLATKVKAKARSDEQPGVSAIPDGRDCYAKKIRGETSLDLPPEQIHQKGKDEVARIRSELSALGAKVLGTSDVAEIQRRLRQDPAMHFAAAEEVETKARTTLERAEAAIPRYFGILPRARCEVKVMGLHEAPNSTIAYYRQPAIDGSRPGTYMINTYKPETRPRYEAEALAFHEAIPGHHLQIAIAQELQGLPEFRKHEGTTAYVEGWALYTEKLSDEMGLYSSDLDRIGMLSFDAWRACRLVVDTGIHALGWSRQQAIDYMVQNTVLAENNIANEVDRYISWPGQALAYKLGQLEILKLRDEARQKLGERFDIRGFHDVVLRDGAVALPVLREQVEAWIAAGGAAH